MHWPLLAIVIVLFSKAMVCEERTVLDDVFMGTGRKIQRKALQILLNRLNGYGTYQKEKMRKRMYIIPNTTPFPCNVSEMRSAVPPSSVNMVRPGDIDVIGALGDSLTAGFGLTGMDIFDTLLQNRDKSFSIGGAGTWRQHLTLANILKEFNPKLIGFPTQPSITIMRASQFNVAEGGAISQNMPYMSRILITRIVNDKRVNVKEHWKMITLMIGDNDFCSEICYRSNPVDALQRHKEDILLTLRTLRDNLPRTIVNLIAPPSVAILFEQKNVPLPCYIQHRLSCPCFVSAVRSKQELQLYKDIVKRWQQLELEIANYEEFNKDDFTVIGHSFMENLVIPRTGDGSVDLTYFAHDCFHLSQKGNAAVANTLWNSLLQPDNAKINYTQEYHTGFLCPSKDHPYIYTRGNS